MATPQSVNEEVALVVYEALEQAHICSDRMDLVPRPPSKKEGIKWIIKQLSKIGQRVMSGNTAIYNTCKVQVAKNYKLKINSALMGL